jgi:hypothetical protein
MAEAGRKKKEWNGANVKVEKVLDMFDARCGAKLRLKVN